MPEPAYDVCPECYAVFFYDHAVPDNIHKDMVDHCVKFPGARHHAGIWRAAGEIYYCVCGEKFYYRHLLYSHIAGRGGLYLHYFKCMLGIE